MTRLAQAPNRRHISTLAAMLCLSLAACGGGGGGSSTSTTTETSSDGTGTTTTPTTPTDTTTPDTSATVVAFVKGSYPKFEIGSNLMTNVGTLGTETQASNGGFSALGSLSTTAAVSDISGNADYAIGRWADGKHYAVFNNTGGTSLPVGTLTCDSGVFTHPTLDGNSATTGTATGSATLAFTDASHANIGLTINVSSSASSGTGTLSTTATAGSMNVKGFNGGSAIIGSGNNSQAQMYLAIGTGNTYLLATYYQLKLADASYYTGVAMFTCH